MNACVERSVHISGHKKCETHEKKKYLIRRSVAAHLMCLQRIQVETDEDKSVYFA